MRTLPTVILLLLTLLLSVYAQSPECSPNKECGEEDECCPDVVLGDVCYNPSTHRCVSFTGQCRRRQPDEPEPQPEPPTEPEPVPPTEPNVTDPNVTIPEPPTEPNVTEPNVTMPEPPPENNDTTPQPDPALSFCGDHACYDEATGTCFLQRRLCGIEDNACGTICYDTNTHTCFQEDKLCAIGERPCGDACYDPELFICNTELMLDPRPDEITCGANNEACGSTEECCTAVNEEESECFDPIIESCCRVTMEDETGQATELIAVCGLNENEKAELCCPSADGQTAECYDPETHFCCHSEDGMLTGPACPLEEDFQGCCAGLTNGNTTSPF